ncbi:hypothetical protein [Streptomyces sp. NPDC048442]|uniref:hypothetical protein n=1 Tax=Streptomyces sp. NPDC048442 TaxID=3154823 RepID=UPI00344781DA
MAKHQSVTDYIAARQAGDAERCHQIVAEVRERFATRTTDGTEIAELYAANQTVPLAGS